MDTSPNFDSSNIIMVTSWNDVGFDVINQTYNVSTALDKREKLEYGGACNQRYKSNRQLVKCIPLLIARYYNMEHRFKYRKFAVELRHHELYQHSNCQTSLTPGLQILELEQLLTNHLHHRSKLEQVTVERMLLDC